MPYFRGRITDISSDFNPASVQQLSLLDQASNRNKRLYKQVNHIGMNLLSSTLMILTYVPVFNFLYSTPRGKEILAGLLETLKQNFIKRSLQDVVIFNPENPVSAYELYQQYFRSMQGFGSVLMPRKNYENIRDLFVKLVKTSDMEAIFQLEFILALTLALASPAIAKLVLGPVINKLSFKLLHLCFPESKSPALISDLSARKYLSKYNKSNEYYSKLMGNISSLSMGAIGIMIFYFLVHAYLRGGILGSSSMEISDDFTPIGQRFESSPRGRINIQGPVIPPYGIILLVSTLLVLAESLYNNYKENKARQVLKNKLMAAKIAFTNAITITVDDGVEQVGFITIKDMGSIEDSFITFNADTYGLLSKSLVNQIVKDILLQNAISILQYDKHSHTFQIQLLTAAEIKSINQKIKTSLDRYQAIKVLTQQLERFFLDFPIIQSIALKDGLPTASFIISFELKENKLASLRGTFPECQIRAEDKYVLINGHTSASKAIVDSARFIDLTLTTSHANDKSGSHKRKTKSAQPAAAVAAQEIPASLSPAAANQWPYVNNIHQGEVKRVNHPFFGRNHFVLFAIPADVFPSVSMHAELKAKVEEGHLATNAVGQQGLQFRAESARDMTRPGNPWFLSSMRYKGLGRRIGDIRLYAEKETVDNKHLFVFKGLNLRAH